MDTGIAEYEAAAVPSTTAAQPGAAEAGKVIEEWRRFFGTSADTVTETPAQIRESLRAFFEKGTGGTDARAYLQSVALDARKRPVQGLMRALTYLPYALSTYPATLWRLVTTNVQDAASGWKTKVLAAPGAQQKYFIYERLVIPLDALGAALTREAASVKRHVDQVLRDVDRTVNDAEEFLKKQWQGARDFFGDVVLSVKQRSLGGAATEVERFAITAPVPAESREPLTRLTSTYVAQGYGKDEALHYAALALGAFERFPRNWPTLGRPIETLAPRAKLFDAPSPALHAVLSTLWMFPPAGKKVEIGADDLTSRVELLANGSSLRLTVTVNKRGRVPVAPSNIPLV